MGTANGQGGLQASLINILVFVLQRGGPMVSEAVVDSLKALLFIIILSGTVIYLPIINILGIVFWPVPVVFIFIKYDMLAAMKLIIAAAVINSALFSPLMGLVTVVGFGFIGFVIGSCFQEEISSFRTLLYTIGVVFLSLSVMLFILYYLLGIDFSFFIQEFEDVLAQIPEFEHLEEYIMLQLEWMEQILPALLITGSIIIGILNYYISAWYLWRKNYAVETFTPLKYWYFPHWPVSIALIISLLLSQNIIFMNLNFLLFVLVFIQGFAVCFYFIGEVLKSTLIKAVFVFILFTVPFMFLLVLLIGLVDMWFNLRNLKKAE